MHEHARTQCTQPACMQTHTRCSCLVPECPAVYGAAEHDVMLLRWEVEVGVVILISMLTWVPVVVLCVRVVLQLHGKKTSGTARHYLHVYITQILSENNRQLKKAGIWYSKFTYKEQRVTTVRLNLYCTVFSQNCQTTSVSHYKFMHIWSWPTSVVFCRLHD